MANEQDKASDAKQRRLRYLGLFVTTGIIELCCLLGPFSRPVQLIAIVAGGVSLGLVSGDALGGRRGTIIGAVFAFVFLVSYVTVWAVVLSPLFTP